MSNEIYISLHSRRAFLRGAGGILFSIPFLPSLIPQSHAQTISNNLNRLVTFFIGSGSGYSVWFPNVPSSAMTTQGPGYRAIQISDIIKKNGLVSPIFSDPRIAKYAQHLNLYRGLDGNYGAGSHCKSYALTAEASDDTPEGSSANFPTLPSYPSIDYLISRSSNIYSTEPFSRIGILGVADSPNHWSGVTTSFSQSNTGTIAPILPNTNPITAFDYYFKNIVIATDQTLLAKLKYQRKSVLDTVLTNFKRVIASNHLATSEKHTLEDHVEKFRDLEKKVDAIQVSACSSLPSKAKLTDFKSRPDQIAKNFFPNTLDLPLIMDMMTDITATALRCQLTQVVTIILDASNIRWDHIGLADGHRLSHARDADSEEKWILASNQTQKYQSILISKIMNMVEKLDIDDPMKPGTKMLDNTLILGTNELGSEGNHRPWAMPVFTIGGGSRVNSGWYIDYRTQNQIQPNYAGVLNKPWLPPVYHGRDYNSFLIGVMLAMGLKPSDWEQGGVPGFGSYSFTGEGKWYKETESSDKGIITPGKRLPPPFMLKA